MIRRMAIGVITLLAVSLTLTIGRGTVQAQPPSPLEVLLNQVPDNRLSRTVLWYGALGDLEKVLNIQIKSPDDFKKLNIAQQSAYLSDVSTKQVYYSPFSGLDKPADWLRVFGINSYAIDREMQVGTAPNWYGILQGQFSSASITKALQAVGFKAATISGKPALTLGADNAAPSGTLSQLVDARYNRVVVSDSQIIAGPSNDVVQQALDTKAARLTADPAYTALVRLLQQPDILPSTQLISAALFNGPYLSDTVITADPLAASVGSSMSASDRNKLKAKIGLDKEKVLPRYLTAGFGYRRDAKNRYWEVALIYKDAAAAKSANDILADRLGRYQSFRQDGRQLFQGWKISVRQIQVGGSPAVLAVMQLPSQTDVSWIDLINTRDLGFLATER